MALAPVPGSGSAWDFSDLMDFLASNRQSIVSDSTQIQVDWKETPKAHIIKADLPGLTKEDVKIHVEEGKRILEISGELSRKEVNKNEGYIYMERPRGSFSRRLWLPEDVMIDEVKAKMENGVLILTLPKTPGRELRKKSILISSG